MAPAAAARRIGLVRSRRARSEARRQAGEVEQVTAELVLLTDLRSALIDERSWALGALGVEDIGLTVDIVAGLTGIDLDVEATRARAQVDDLVAAAALPRLADRVAETRAQGRVVLAESGQLYGLLEDEVAVRADGLLDRLIASSGDVAAGGSLVSRLRVLDAASSARGRSRRNCGATSVPSSARSSRSSTQGGSPPSCISNSSPPPGPT